MPAQNHPRIFVFIDESGTLPDKNDKYFVLSAVISKNPSELTNIANKLRKKSDSKHKLQSEIKFYKSGEQTIRKYLGYLNLTESQIYLLIIDKIGRGVGDTPQNYALLANKLIKPIVKRYRRFRIELVFDRHFHNQHNQDQFNEVVLNHFSNRIDRIRHVDSERERAVNSADMVAGSYLKYVTKKNTQYFKLIRKMVHKITRVKWTRAKNENLVRTGVNTHPDEIH